MSLFASAFDTGAGPSTLSSPALGKAHKDGKNKTKEKSKDKRTSDHVPTKGGDRMKSTQVNLQNVMKQVENGEIREKRTGQDAMGGTGKQGKKRVANPNENTEKPGKKQRVETHKVSASGMKVNGSRMNIGDKSQQESKNSAPKRKAEATGRPAPAELPLPHKLPSSHQSGSQVGEAGLTDMQRSMQSKLEGARFRWINEQLYSNPSTEAVAMMQKDPKTFEDYHQTHRALTSAWPSPPLPHLINLLTPSPPKTVIVDLGCGDAGLAKALVPQGKIVMSFDLVGDSGRPGSGGDGGNVGRGWVVEADFLEHVPLPGRPGGQSVPSALENGENDGDTQNASASQAGKKRRRNKGKGREAEASEIVDAVVCCLSLMGTNWVGGVYEACRILKQHGILHIAEVTSRFVSEPAFIEKIESFGFNLEAQQSPSTHFTLFRFTKVSAVPLGPARGENGWNERIMEGEAILRGCVYKKR